PTGEGLRASISRSVAACTRRLAAPRLSRRRALTLWGVLSRKDQAEGALCLPAYRLTVEIGAAGARAAIGQYRAFGARQNCRQFLCGFGRRLARYNRYVVKLHADSFCSGANFLMRHGAAFRIRSVIDQNLVAQLGQPRNIFRLQLARDCNAIIDLFDLHRRIPSEQPAPD